MTSPPSASTPTPTDAAYGRPATDGKVQEGVVTFVDVFQSIAFGASLLAFVALVLCFIVGRQVVRRFRRKQQQHGIEDGDLELDTSSDSPSQVEWVQGKLNRLRPASLAIGEGAELRQPAGYKFPQRLNDNSLVGDAAHQRHLFVNSGADFCRKSDGILDFEERHDHDRVRASIDQKRIVFPRYGFSIGHLSLRVLENVVDLLSGCPELDVRVAGYAGKLEWNSSDQVRELARRRAKACADKLVELGAVNLLRWQGAGIDRKFDYGFARIVPSRKATLLQTPQARLDCILSRAAFEFHGDTRFLTRRGWQVVDMCARVLGELRRWDLAVAVVTSPSQERLWQAEAVKAALLRKDVRCAIQTECTPTGAGSEGAVLLRIDGEAEFALVGTLAPPLEPVIVEEVDYKNDRNCFICADLLCSSPLQL